MEAKDRAQALAAVQEAANAAAAVVAAAEATAAAVKRAVQAAEALVAELDAPTSNGTYNTAALKVICRCGRRCTTSGAGTALIVGTFQGRLQAMLRGFPDRGLRPARRCTLPTPAPGLPPRSAAAAGPRLPCRRCPGRRSAGGRRRALLV